jgi:hypothetical protein
MKPLFILLLSTLFLSANIQQDDVTKQAIVQVLSLREGTSLPMHMW